MALTDAQKQTLRTNITVTRAATNYDGQTLLQWWNAGNDQKLANFYNETAVPVVKLWKPSVAVEDLNNGIVGAEFIALTIARQNLWLILTQGPVNATLSRVRQNFIEVFGSASTTMANLTLVAQKDASYLEGLFSSSGGAPGTANVSAVFGAQLTGTEVGQSRFV